jgi:hypothetical protein
VLAVRLSLQASDAYRDGRAWWRSERRIRLAVGGYAGQCWAIEAELTPKPLARTTGIMAGLLARTAGYQPGAPPGPGPRYDRVVYLAIWPRRRARQTSTPQRRLPRCRSRSICSAAWVLSGAGGDLGGEPRSSGTQRRRRQRFADEIRR